jgi:hypothetical protein
MSEYSAQERAALAAVAFLIEGPQKAQEIVNRLYDSEYNGWEFLNNISQPLNLVNDGGWWYVSITPFSDVAPLLSTIRDRLEETKEGHAYCRPLSRKDMAKLEKLLEHILKIGKPPEP